MTFNPDPKKQAQQVIFSSYLSVYLDGKLDFRKRHQNTFKKINKTISLSRKLRNNLPRAPLVIISESLIKPHLNYKDISFDQTFNNSFTERLESIQYNAALAMKGVIRGSSREKRYKDLGSEFLQQQSSYRKFLSVFQNNKKPIFQVPL